MMKSQNKYSIRKFSVGASSILIATLLFLSGGQAQAAEKQVNMGNSRRIQLQHNLLGINKLGKMLIINVKTVLTNSNILKI
ncbi:YSIRK-type signal peptide-containing protein [Staphylococcus aureus]